MAHNQNIVNHSEPYAGWNAPAPQVSELIANEDFTTISADLNAQGFWWSEPNPITVDPTDATNSVLEFTFGPDADGVDSADEQRFGMPPQQELWVSYRLYIPANYYHRTQSSTANNKGFFTFWYDDYNKTNRIEFWPQANGESSLSFAYGNYSVSYTIHQTTDSDGQSNIMAIVDADRGQWVDIVIHLKVASGPGNADGEMQIWKNGASLCHWYGIENASWEGADNAFAGGNIGFGRGYLLGWANSGFTEETKLLIDDFKMGTTAAQIGFVE